MALLTTLSTVVTTLTLLPTTATILPAPHSSAPASGLLTTNVIYHQGVMNSNGTSSAGTCEGMQVAAGNLTAGYCVGLHTFGISLSRLESVECAFRLFKGSATCGVDANEITNVPMPSGDGQVCIVTGVEDGGMFTKASGFWVCG
ncbi:hypothetical protein WHR41_01604 [Cladosporium halotolerans]|uniref:Uncharacterized protein n=1 Tax=Cladosporium halotolerans TaxID=1052096 RepID=A0AB34L1K6_9PEZI